MHYVAFDDLRIFNRLVLPVFWMIGCHQQQIASTEM